MNKDLNNYDLAKTIYFDLNRNTVDYRLYNAILNWVFKSDA